MTESTSRSRAWTMAVAAGLAFALAQWPLATEQVSAQGAAQLPPCRAHGVVMSGGAPLPGASVTAKVGERVVAVTSTDVDGTYIVPLAPGTYLIHVELTSFASVDRTVTLGAPPCESAADVAMTLASRMPGASIASTAPLAALVAPVAATAGANPGAGGGRGGGIGRGGRGGEGGRFGG
ncbi:MAG: carboxypeptidase-like regulatory domain-containing protein, partial [Acidobacteriota bacterium]